MLNKYSKALVIQPFILMVLAILYDSNTDSNSDSNDSNGDSNGFL